MVSLYIKEKNIHMMIVKNRRKMFLKFIKLYDDLDELLNKQVIHHVTKEKINFSNI
jgi:hypothetical protein